MQTHPLFRLPFDHYGFRQEYRLVTLLLDHLDITKAAQVLHQDPDFFIRGDIQVRERIARDAESLQFCPGLAIDIKINVAQPTFL